LPFSPSLHTLSTKRFWREGIKEASLAECAKRRTFQLAVALKIPLPAGEVRLGRLPSVE
jgi:hypothetical protein